MPDPSTTRLALYKSKSDGSELVNYTQDIGQNWDKVDNAVGFQVVTSSTRPATPYAGKPIAESDTAYRTLFSNGTAPASASWVEIPNSSATFNNNLKLAAGKQVNIGASGSTASYVALLSSATGDYIMASRATGDSVSRLTIRADGRLDWSSGTTAVDTNLFRDTANVLRTNDSLTVDLNLSVAGNASVTGNLTVSGIGQSLFARKTADTSRASTVTMTDDPHLTVSLAASATYIIYAYIVYQAGTTGDINVAFTQPSGAAGSWQGTGLGRGVGASVGIDGFTVRMNTNDIGTTQPRSYGGDTTNQAIQIMGVVRTSSAGTFAVQWSQASTDATATILRTDSWMQLTRVA
ncbi:hypothetical protein [Streptomyces sp. NPDC001530]|uniref:hypothetical protein n=1 Tax=Streptomyces sp. NPDC001530 TaxID=3364582 RepID=UPI00368BEF2F